MSNRAVGIVVIIGLLGVVAVLQSPPVSTGGESGYGTATVSIHDENGTELGTVEVRIADTRDKRSTGLSETDSLEDGHGMLFVHDEPGEYGYVMRNMSFSLDIVFIAGDGTITTIHPAPAPAGEYEEVYRGEGMYVLEVPKGWSNETGVSVGDSVRIPDDVT